MDALTLARQPCAAELVPASSKAPQQLGAAYLGQATQHTHLLQIRKRPGRGYRTVRVQTVIHTSDKWSEAVTRLQRDQRRGSRLLSTTV